MALVSNLHLSTFVWIPAWVVQVWNLQFWTLVPRSDPVGMVQALIRLSSILASRSDPVGMVQASIHLSAILAPRSGSA